MAADLIRTSKFLSLVLRHEPERIGLVLDGNGWALVDDLLAKAAASGVPLTRELIETVVATSDKQRFALSPDGTRIRANQGHSVEVDLALPPLTPPEVLYHGTAEQNVASILAAGVHRAERHHVHLSADEATARRVGGRHGLPVVLRIRAGAMHAAGHVFYRSGNGVWLTDHVPPAFIEPLPRS